MNRARVNHLFSHLGERGFSHLFFQLLSSPLLTICSDLSSIMTLILGKKMFLLFAAFAALLSSVRASTSASYSDSQSSLSPSPSRKTPEKRRVKEGVIIGPLMNVGSFTDLPSSNRSRQLSTLELRFSLSRLLLFGSPRRSILPSHLTMLSQRLPPSHYAFLYYFSIIGDRP
jgi:hypothetical protein